MLIDKAYVCALKNRVIGGCEIAKQQALELVRCEDLGALFAAADEIRREFCGDKFNLCTIINVKSGCCSEDCKYCAQSAHFNTGCETYGILSERQVLSAALANEAEQTHRFSLVASGRGISQKSSDLGAYCEIYERLRSKTRLHLCASLGIASKPALALLKASGVQTYHHNLETSRKFYPQICTTHSYDDRIQTIENCRAVGLDVCSGGIFGLGEGMEDRIDMALQLRELGVSSVPINILTPIKGTPLQNAAPLAHDEILKSIAIYRFILPRAYLRFAGGRRNLGEHVRAALGCGINSALTGNFLTTTGDSIASDKALVAQCGFDLAKGAD